MLLETWRPESWVCCLFLMSSASLYSPQQSINRLGEHWLNGVELPRFHLIGDFAKGHSTASQGSFGSRAGSRNLREHSGPILGWTQSTVVPSDVQPAVLGILPQYLIAGSVSPFFELAVPTPRGECPSQLPRLRLRGCWLAVRPPPPDLRSRGRGPWLPSLQHPHRSGQHPS